MYVCSRIHISILYTLIQYFKRMIYLYVLNDSRHVRVYILI